MIQHSTQKRLAAKVLKVGINKVWFDSNRLEEINESLTKQDIKDLIKDGAIKAKAISYKKVKKKKKKRKTTGKIKKRRKRRKEKYVNLIRKLRKYLKGLKQGNKIKSKEHNHLRKLAKAGHFKSKKHLKDYVDTVVIKGLAKKEIKKPKNKKRK